MNDDGLSTWLSSQPDVVIYVIAAMIALLAFVIGRGTKRAIRLPIGPAVQQLRRIADTIESEHKRTQPKISGTTAPQPRER